MRVSYSAYSAQAQSTYAQAARSEQATRAAEDVVHSRKAVGFRLGKLGIRFETEETLDGASIAREAGDRLNRLRRFNFTESLQAQDAELYEAISTPPAASRGLAAIEQGFASPNYNRNVGVRSYQRVASQPMHGVQTMLRGKV